MKPQLLKTFLLFLITLIVQNTIAQLPDLIPYRKGNLWGYCDSSKSIKITPQFDSAGWFDKYGRAEVVFAGTDKKTKWIDRKGDTIPEGYGNMGDKVYYKINGDSIWVIDKATKKQGRYPFLLKNAGNKLNQEEIAYADGKTTHIYRADGSSQALKLKKIKRIIRFITENELQVSVKNNAVTPLGVGQGLVYETHKGDTFIKFDNRKKPDKVKDSWGYVKLSIAGSSFIYNNAKNQEASVFNTKGELMFTHKVKSGLAPFGKSFFSESYYASDSQKYRANILDSNGSYVVKGINKNGSLDFSGISNGQYYRLSDSCYLYQDIEGKPHTLCSNTGKMEAVQINANFIVFKTTDSTINVYNRQAKQLLENWRDPNFHQHELYGYYEVMGEEYFPLTINGQQAVMDKNGKTTVMQGGYDGLMHVGSFFLMANADGITLIDSTGKMLKHYGFFDYTPMGTYPQYGLVSSIHWALRSPRSAIIIPLEIPFDAKGMYLHIDSNQPHDRIDIYDYPAWLYINGATCKEITIKDCLNMLHISASDKSYKDFVGRLRVFPVNDGAQLYGIWITREKKTNVYCYMDKYGTVYYDE